MNHKYYLWSILSSLHVHVPMSASRIIIQNMFSSLLAPNSSLPLNMTDVEVSETAVDIYLWPIEQENGPIR